VGADDLLGQEQEAGRSVLARVLANFIEQVRQDGMGEQIPGQDEHGERTPRYHPDEQTRGRSDS
jgi:hypothetical protein